MGIESVRGCWSAMPTCELRQLNRGESIFASGDEPPVSLPAGSGDAEVVLLQLPVKTAEYRSKEQTA